MFNLNEADLLQWFKQSPQGQQILTERSNEHQAERERLVSQLAENHKRDLKNVKAMGEKIAIAEATLSEAQDRAAECLGVVRGLKAQKYNASFTFSRESDAIRRRLRETFEENELIDKFQHNLANESLILRRGSSISEETQSIEDDKFNIRIQTVSSNLGSIRRRLAAIGQAYESAEAMRLMAVTDVAKRLQKLYDDLPVVRLEATANARK